VSHEINDISKGEIMKQPESCKEERLKKKQEEQEPLDLYEEMIRRLYLGPDSGSNQIITCPKSEFFKDIFFDLQLFCFTIWEKRCRMSKYARGGGHAK